MTAGRKAVAGAFIWIVAAWARVPSLHHGAWAEALLWLVTLVISPLLIELVADATDDARRMTLLRWAMLLQFPAAVLLVGSFWLPVLGAVACSVPWAVTLVLLALVGLLRVAGRPARLDAALCRDVGLMYSAIGAAWLLAMTAAFSAWRRDRRMPPVHPGEGLEPEHADRLTPDA